MEYVKVDVAGVVYYVSPGNSRLRGTKLPYFAEFIIDTNDNTIIKSRYPIEMLVDSFVKNSEQPMV